MKSILLNPRTILLYSFFLLIAEQSDVMAQPKMVHFRAWDKMEVTADLYAPNAATAPFIILYHQANYSRGEFIEIAPKLNELGFNCMAVDLRSGGVINNVENKTYHLADSLKKETRYTDAYGDLRAAVSYVRKTYPGAKIILLGSSYSASLAIKMAGDYPTNIAGVVAYSPGEYFSKFGWARDIIQQAASKAKCPIYITSAKSEEESWIKIYNAIPVSTKVKFIPNGNGQHGAKALWKVFPEHTEYWASLKKFLAQFK